MNTPRRKYSFYDVFIFRKTPKGYIDITSFSFDDKYYFEASAYHDFDSDSKYLIALWYGNVYLIAPISISELLLLANTKENSCFTNQCRYAVEPSKADDILAMICANKIANHKYGSISLKVEDLPEGKACETISYKFMRKKSVGKSRVYCTLLEKNFKVGV